MKANQKAIKKAIDNLNWFEYAKQLMKGRTIDRIRMLDNRRILDKKKRIKQAMQDIKLRKRNEKRQINIIRWAK